MGIARSAARGLVPIGLKLAPQVAAGVVRELLARAISGAGPYRGVVAAARAHLTENGGDRPAAVAGLIDRHVRAAGVQGFRHEPRWPGHDARLRPGQRLGAGAAAVPPGRGDRARCTATTSTTHAYATRCSPACSARRARATLVRSGDLPSSPMGLATSPVHNPVLDATISQAVSAELLGRVTGRRMVTTFGRRIPMFGGGVGAVSDGVSTYRVGRYAERKLAGPPVSGSRLTRAERLPAGPPPSRGHLTPAAARPSWRHGAARSVPAAGFPARCSARRACLRAAFLARLRAAIAGGSPSSSAAGAGCEPVTRSRRPAAESELLRVGKRFLSGCAGPRTAPTPADVSSPAARR